MGLLSRAKQQNTDTSQENLKNDQQIKKGSSAEAVKGQGSGGKKPRSKSLFARALEFRKSRSENDSIGPVSKKGGLLERATRAGSQNAYDAVEKTGSVQDSLSDRKSLRQRALELLGIKPKPEKSLQQSEEDAAAGESSSLRDKAASMLRASADSVSQIKPTGKSEEISEPPSSDLEEQDYEDEASLLPGVPSVSAVQPEESISDESGEEKKKLHRYRATKTSNRVTRAGKKIQVKYLPQSCHPVQHRSV